MELLDFSASAKTSAVSICDIYILVIYLNLSVGLIDPQPKFIYVFLILFLSLYPLLFLRFDVLTSPQASHY
jgi:hypothetical protein